MNTALAPAFPKPAHVHKTRKPMRQHNRKRRTAMYERNYGERGGPVRAMACLVANSGDCRGPIEAAHVAARKMGSVGGDRRSLVPLCQLHHREQGRSLRDFQQNHQLDLHAEADRIARELDARGLP